MGFCRAVDGTPEKHVTLEGIIGRLNVVELFRYLGDEICPGGACKLATIGQTRAT